MAWCMKGTWPDATQKRLLLICTGRLFSAWKRAESMQKNASHYWLETSNFVVCLLSAIADWYTPYGETENIIRAANNFSFLKGHMSDQVSVLVRQNRTMVGRFLLIIIFQWKSFWNNYYFSSLFTYYLVKKYVHTQCPKKVKISSDVGRF